MKKLFLRNNAAGGQTKYKKYFLLGGSLLMGISFFLPWVTFGEVLSGYDLADMYSKSYENASFLRFASVPKIAIGIFVLFLFRAPGNFIYYIAPVLSLVPITILDGIIFEYQSIHYGVYLLHLAVIFIWIGAFSYKEPYGLIKKVRF